MADTAVEITSGTGTNIDTRTEATNGHHRQVVVLGDPATNAGVAPVDATAGLKVDLGADNDITGTVTANAGTNLNTSSLALEAGGNLAAIKAKTDNIPALGQALADASVPVILPSATITTLTPPAAITGFATSAKQDTIISHVDGLEALATTIAGAVSGTEMQTDIVGALPAGTNTIGKLAANSGVDIGDVDVTSVPRSLMGPAQPGTAIDSYTHAAINLAAAADQVLVSSAANKQIWVYGISFVVNVAGTVSFQDEDNTAITGVMPFAANSGMAIAPSGNFSMPIWKLGTDKDLEVDVVTSEIDGWIDYAIVSV